MDACTTPSGRRSSRQGDDQPEHPDDGSDRRGHAVLLARLLLPAVVEGRQARLRRRRGLRPRTQLAIPREDMVRGACVAAIRSAILRSRRMPCHAMI